MLEPSPLLSNRIVKEAPIVKDEYSVRGSVPGIPEPSSQTLSEAADLPAGDMNKIVQVFHPLPKNIGRLLKL